MLELKVQISEEMYNDDTQQFVYEFYTLRLEHSLVSMSKWESFFEKPFLSEEPKVDKEVFWYVRAMCLDDDVPEEVFERLSEENIKAIDEYINSKQTATTFREIQKKAPAKEIVTAEIVYYWMVALSIPFECQYWHLNRLITLVKVCNLKNQPAEKMSRKDALAHQRALNAQRRKAARSSG